MEEVTATITQEESQTTWVIKLMIENVQDSKGVFRWRGIVDDEHNAELEYQKKYHMVTTDGRQGIFRAELTSVISTDLAGSVTTQTKITGIGPLIQSPAEPGK
jgi:hypothetical protein